MARIRTIKPQHWSDKELPKISLQAHLLWIATWNFSDDEGIFEADPLFIRSQVFPRRTDVRVEQVSQWLDQLVKARFIIPFTHEGESYYISRTFGTHQKIDKPQPSKIPSDIIRRAFDEHSEKGRPSNVEYSKGKDSSVVVENPPPSFGNSVLKNIEDLKRECLNDQVNFVEYICRQTKISPEEVPKLLEDFNSHLRSIGETVKGVKDYRNHAQNWIKKQPEVKHTGQQQSVKIRVK